MQKLLFIICALPLIGTAQVFTKIDASVTGFTQGVNSPSQTLKTQDGHIWFNSLVANRNRLYEYDGTSYAYHYQYYDSTLSGYRDLSASYFAQTPDGTIYTQGGQFYKNGVWRKTPFQQQCFAQSQDGTTLYLNKTNDSIFSFKNGVMTGYDIALNQIPGIAGPSSGVHYYDVVADNQDNLYFATKDTGVIKINVPTKTVTYMPIYFQGMFLAETRALHLASNGHLYVGSDGEFLGYHDGTRWHIMVNMKPWDYGMDRVDDFAEDSHGRVWVGSNTGSLYGFLGRFDESDTTQLFDIIWDTTANHEFISNRNIEAILIENDSTFYFGVYQERYLLRVNVSHTVSIDEPISIGKLSAYPNPASNKLWFSEITNGLAEIYSLTGKKMDERYVENASLDLHFISPGAYILQVTDEDGQYHRMKLIKQ